LLNVCEDIGEEWVADKDLAYGNYRSQFLPCCPTFLPSFINVLLL